MNQTDCQSCVKVVQTPESITFHDMLLVRCFYPLLWTIPTGAIWGEVSQGHNDMLQWGSNL